MARHYKQSESDFYCTGCGQKGCPIFRKKGQERPSGHLKKLYCIACQKEVNHAEVRDINSNYNYQDFLDELYNGCIKYIEEVINKYR